MKLRACRIAAVVAAALTLVGTWLLYRGDFWPLRTEEQKLAAIVEYASAKPGEPSHMRAVLHPVLLFDESFGDRRILVFTDSEIDSLLGNVQFRRGFLGGWQPLSGRYDTPPVMQSAPIQGRDLRVVYAADCPPEIASYKVQANLDNDETLMAEGVVDASRFFHVHETDRSFFPALNLFDADGNHLDDARYLATDPSIPSPSIGSAEINLVNVFCALLLGLGWLIVKYLWDGGTSPSGPPVDNPKRTAE